MTDLPFYVYVIFGITTLAAFWFIYRASNRSNLLLGVFCCWLILQGFVAGSGFYLVTGVLPPRFLWLVIPPLITIVLFFVTKPGRVVLDRIDTRTLTYLHSVRLPVEITLWLLFTNKLVPEVMTFEGRNLDILSGVTAPFVAFFGYTKAKLGRSVMLAWNFICLALLINIVATAIFAAPFPFQKLGFEQPNVGVLYFPFIWLPGFIVPLVLFSHLATIRQLLLKSGLK